jgi:hypothetical protein
MEEFQRKRLIKQRGVAKASLTRLQKYITSDERKLNQLQVRFDELPVILSKFETAQHELEVQDDTDHTSDREEFEEQYFQVKERFLELMYPRSTKDPADSASERSSSSTHSAHNSSYVRLPSIELPSFDGNISKWFYFRDTFDSMIIQNRNLQSIQKFHYLISSLKGEAKGLIANLPITHDNFQVAWDLVTHRFNNVKIIAMTHVKQLLQLPSVKKNDATSLRHYINHVNSNLNAIKALALKTSTHDLMMNHLLLSGLDSNIQNEWELQTATLPDIPATAEIIAFLETRRKALEMLQANQPLATSTPRQATAPNKVSQPAHCYMVTQAQCILCKRPHRLYQCYDFKNKSPTERLKYIKQQHACFNCLQQNYTSHTCSKSTCKTCNRKHHTLLHEAMQPQSADCKVNSHNSTSKTKDKPDESENSTSEDETASTTEQTSTLTTDGATNEAQTYCSFKNKTTPNVLLATAIVKVRNNQGQYISCRALLDSGAQVSFITEKCVQRLKLSRSQTDTSIQGINNVNTATHHSVCIHLRSRVTGWHSSLTCAVLPNITSNLPATKLDTSNWKLPIEIQYADETFNKPGPIDLLIGADLFYEVMLPNRRTQPGHPVLQETVFGWIASGKTPAVNTSNLTQQSLLARNAASTEVHPNCFQQSAVQTSIDTRSSTNCN